MQHCVKTGIRTVRMYTHLFRRLLAVQQEGNEALNKVHAHIPMAEEDGCTQPNDAVVTDCVRSALLSLASLPRYTVVQEVH